MLAVARNRKSVCSLLRRQIHDQYAAAGTILCYSTAITSPHVVVTVYTALHSVTVYWIIERMAAVTEPLLACVPDSMQCSSCPAAQPIATCTPVVALPQTLIVVLASGANYSCTPHIQTVMSNSANVNAGSFLGYRCKAPSQLVFSFYLWLRDNGATGTSLEIFWFDYLSCITCNFKCVIRICMLSLSNNLCMCTIS